MAEAINLDETMVHLKSECSVCHGSGERPYSGGITCYKCKGEGQVERWVPLLDFMRAINVQPADWAERAEAESRAKLEREIELLRRDMEREDH